MTVFLSLLQQRNFKVDNFSLKNLLFQNFFVALWGAGVNIFLESRMMPQSLGVLIRKCIDDEHSGEISGRSMLFGSISYLNEQKRNVRPESPESASIKGEAYLIHCSRTRNWTANARCHLFRSLTSLQRCSSKINFITA